MKQWEKRVVSFEIIYSFLMREKIPNDYNEYILSANEDIKKIIEYFVANFEEIKKKVVPFIKEGWSWERLHVVDRAIICNAICESNVFNTDKKIIIDQSIKTAKNFSDINSYKFINSILDKIL